MGKRHPAETCECPNRKLGCKVRVRQTELQSHVDQCLYRWVACEACGKRLLDVDLYKHQRHARCMENKLKREVARNARTTSASLRQHTATLRQERNRLEVDKKKIFHDHLHRMRGWKPRVPSALGVDEGYSSSSPDIVESPLTVEYCDSEGQVEQRLQFPSRLRMVPVTCAKCGKRFRSTANNTQSCFWHMGN
ncbi:hypothetical protein NP493_556g00011 [Ridgeia piscesae]|uniref:Uncharacterized protein n=1 Tax=Ridgeia piscesae TaxID=27915 RepID=A0AAD9KV98_RIDPI|nr:hypothetical protein NP493_556g00011 [Ridgeia piscesae]